MTQSFFDKLQKGTIFTTQKKPAQFDNYIRIVIKKSNDKIWIYFPDLNEINDFPRWIYESKNKYKIINE